MSLWLYVHESCGHSHPENATCKLSYLMFLAFLKIKSQVLYYLQKVAFAVFVLIVLLLWKAQK